MFQHADLKLILSFYKPSWRLNRQMYFSWIMHLHRNFCATFVIFCYSRHETKHDFRRIKVLCIGNSMICSDKLCSIICLYYYPHRVCNFHMQIFQIKLKYHCSKPSKLQKFPMQQYNPLNTLQVSLNTISWSLCYPRLPDGFNVLCKNIENELRVYLSRRVPF